jgi:hypothetical protein
MVVAFVVAKLALKQALRTGVEVAVVAGVAYVGLAVAKDKTKQLLGLKRS